MLKRGWSAPSHVTCITTYLSGGKAAQKDTDARWTLKFAKARSTADGRPQPDIAIPSFGYKSSISISRTFGFIRKGKVTDGARYDGRMLSDLPPERSLILM